jgi:hypothetical protein
MNKTSSKKECDSHAASMRNRKAILLVRPKGYSDEFYTPDHIVQALGKFDIDPSAGPKNHARVNIRSSEDGLSKKMVGACLDEPALFWDSRVA